jgi:Druantia protein DruA
VRVYCGRHFSAEDLTAIRELIEQNPTLKRTPLSRRICALLGWTQPNGALKAMSCRVALLRMQAEGLIRLPPSQNPKNGRRPPVRLTAASDPQPLLCQPVHELPALTVQPVSTAAIAQLWNEYLARYHYLGYTPLSGSQMRYEIFSGAQRVAFISFGASAWKLAARERFVGWDEAQRRRNLQLVINNARFLVLPWIQSKGLASKILALIARQLPQDWQQRYGYRPVLLETFVESPRHRGTCYKAANWIHVGQTAGRGKKCRGHQPVLPVKDIWLYPLTKHFRAALCD